MGMAVGYTQAGEWLKYSVSVAESGEYEITGNVAGTNGTGSFVLYMDGTKIGDEIVAPKGADYDAYSEVSGGKVNLTAGAHELKLEIVNDWINIDWVEFSKVSTLKLWNASPDFARNLNGKYTVYGLSGARIGTVWLDNADLMTAGRQVRDKAQKNGVFVLKNRTQSIMVNTEK